MSSQADLKFIKGLKAYDSETLKNEEVSIYLFGLKIEPDAITALCENHNLLLSILSRGRCIFCYKQASKKKAQKPNQVSCAFLC